MKRLRDYWTGESGAAAVEFGLVFPVLIMLMLGVVGFWTAQSWGPRFCFEIVLEFCAGADFSVDLLPEQAQAFIIEWAIVHIIKFP